MIAAQDFQTPAARSTTPSAPTAECAPGDVFPAYLSFGSLRRAFGPPFVCFQQVLVSLQKNSVASSGRSTGTRRRLGESMILP